MMPAQATLHAVEPAACSDAELVQDALQGKLDAFGDLIQRHQQALYRYCRGMSLDHDASLDLVQDALLKAYTRLPECRTPEHFRAWIFSITRNLCLDYLKNVRRQCVPLSRLPDAEFISADNSELSELNCNLREALYMLSPETRDAFLLKHDAGYTYEEAAEICGISASALKMRVHRAREVLRTFLTDDVTIGLRPVVLEADRDKEEL